jgi:hypothetical protein
MINCLSSNASTPSDLFKDVPRGKDEDNLQWLSRNLPTGDIAHLAMVGGKERMAFRLRIAQSHLFLLGKIAKNIGSTLVHEISLEPKAGFGFPPPTNGVQLGKLDRYGDPDEYPNIAILGVPVAFKEAKKALERFQTQRVVLDAVELALRWLAFGWGASRTGNPLLEGQGIPSAAMLEVVFGAAGFDLTPGLESRSSCPEAIWQAAKWWHEYYERDNRPALTGAYCVTHKL